MTEIDSIVEKNPPINTDGHVDALRSKHPCKQLYLLIDVSGQLISLNLNSKGNKATLKARLQKIKRQEPMVTKKDAPRPLTDPLKLEYLLICDLEATCNASPDSRPKSSDTSSSQTSHQESEPFKPEIIEFPILLYSIPESRVLAWTRTYIRPVLSPTLSDFCTSLTGITQGQVDSADTFPAALCRLESWLLKETEAIGFVPGLMDDDDNNNNNNNTFHRNEQGRQRRKGYTASRNAYKGPHQFKGPRFRTRNWAWCTDGRTDLETFIALQLEWSEFTHFPTYFLGPYVDSRALFMWHTEGKRGRTGSKLVDQLSFFGLRFEGKEHSGLDDSRNIARLVGEMIKRGWTIECNRFLEEVERGWVGDWSRKRRERREKQEKEKEKHSTRVVDEID